MAFDNFDDFDALGFEGSEQGGTLPWAWFLNDAKNFGLAFKSSPDENMAAEAGIQGGERVTASFDDEETGGSVDIDVTLFRNPTLAVVREVKVAEWIVGNGLTRQKVRAIDDGKKKFPEKTDFNKFRRLKKAFCLLVDDQGSIISTPFMITLKGVTKMTWTDANWGTMKDREPVAILSSQHLNHGKFETYNTPGFEYVGAAPGSKGLHIEKGSREIILERLRIHMGQPKWLPAPSGKDLFRARTLFRPIFNRATVGTQADKRKPGIIVAGFQVPTQENIGAAFIPKAGLPALQTYLEQAYEWETTLERKPKAPEPREMVDCTSWGADWLGDNDPAVPAAPATVAASVPAPSGAPWASDDEPLF